MNRMRIHELTDCTEYRQTLLAQPPRVVHGTVILLIGLVITAIQWSAWTQADLVVRAKGRVRPMVRTEQLADAAAEESQISPLRRGRVVEVHVQEGDQVQKGQLLVRLDTQRLDNDIVRQRRSIRATEDELTKLDQLKTLLTAQFDTAMAKAKAELDQATKRISRAKNRRSSEIRLAKVDVELAKDEFQRLKELERSHAATEAQVVRAVARFREAKLKLEQAQLPVDDGLLQVLQQALELVDREYKVRYAELDANRQPKQAAVEAGRMELANFELEIRQAELCAPSDGTVTSLVARVGDVVNSGQKMLALAVQRGFRIDVAVTSDDVGHLQVGMPARIKLDAYDYQKYGTVAGKIVFVAPDSELGDDSTAHAVPTYTVRIALDGEQVHCGQQSGRIRLGMTGLAEIVTDHESILSLLVRSLRQSISLG